jgi:hypothetical protein
MKPESSLLQSQETSTSSCSEPDHTPPNTTFCLSNIHLDVIHAPTSWSWFLSLSPLKLIANCQNFIMFCEYHVKSDNQQLYLYFLISCHHLHQYRRCDNDTVVSFNLVFRNVVPLYAYHSDRAIRGMACLRPPKNCSCGLESHSRHGYVIASLQFMLSCVYAKSLRRTASTTDCI